MSDDDPPTPPPSDAALLRRAMAASYGMIARDMEAGLETRAAVEALTELLVEKGVLTGAEVVERRRGAALRIAARRPPEGPALTAVHGDESAQALMDCDARLHACGAACCVLFNVTLTEAEVRSGLLAWDLATPYTLPRGPDGHCANLDRATLRCTAWNDRPYVCRGYTCHGDSQVWQDFDAMIPSDRVVALTRRARAKE